MVSLNRSKASAQEVARIEADNDHRYARIHGLDFGLVRLRFSIIDPKMSRQLTAYMVPLNLTRSLIGCKMGDIFEVHAKGMKKHLMEIDEEIEENGADSRPVDVRAIGEPRKTAEPDLEFDRLQFDMDCIKAKLSAGDDVTADIEGFMDKVALTLTGEREQLIERDDDDDEFLPSARDCLRHLFFGEDLDARVGYAYDRLCQILLQRTGQKLPSTNWTEIKRLENWLEVLDEHLNSKGVAMPAARHLAFRGNPLLGGPSDIGFLELEEVYALAEALKPMSFEINGPEDPGLYLADLRKWVLDCSKAGQQLVTIIN